MEVIFREELSPPGIQERPPPGPAAWAGASGHCVGQNRQESGNHAGYFDRGFHTQKFILEGTSLGCSLPGVENAPRTRVTAVDRGFVLPSIYDAG